MRPVILIALLIVCATSETWSDDAMESECQLFKDQIEEAMTPRLAPLYVRLLDQFHNECLRKAKVTSLFELKSVHRRILPVIKSQFESTLLQIDFMLHELPVSSEPFPTTDA